MGVSPWHKDGAAQTPCVQARPVQQSLVCAHASERLRHSSWAELQPPLRAMAIKSAVVRKKGTVDMRFSPYAGNATARTSCTSSLCCGPPWAWYDDWPAQDRVSKDRMPHLNGDYCFFGYDNLCYRLSYLPDGSLLPRFIEPGMALYRRLVSFTLINLSNRTPAPVGLEPSVVLAEAHLLAKDSGEAMQEKVIAAHERLFARILAETPAWQQPLMQHKVDEARKKLKWRKART